MKYTPSFVFVLSAVLPAAAQSELTLAGAVHEAVARQPSLEAARARTKAAEARIPQARSAQRPHVQYQEMLQGGNNPVYVFSTLLTERQFTTADFAIDRLVRPDPVRNFQSTLSAEQTLWDAGATRNGIRAAELGVAMSAEEQRGVAMRTIANVARAYHAVTLADEQRKVAEEALQSAEADGERARTVRAAGMATDADVLAVDVHIAGLKERRIRASADAEVARAALNQAMGRPLDTAWALSTPLKPALPGTSAQERPEVKLAGLAREAASVKEKEARAGLWPQLFIRGALEADRRDFVTTGGGNWVLMGGLRWNLYDGGRSRAAQAEARSLAGSAAAEQRQAQSVVELELRQARAALRSAQERIAVNESSITMAEETLRIVRNRYSSGLSTVTEVLRAQTALTETKTRRLAAVYDQRMAAIQVELAAGILKEDSDVLR